MVILDPDNLSEKSRQRNADKADVSRIKSHIITKRTMRVRKPHWQRESIERNLKEQRKFLNNSIVSLVE